MGASIFSKHARKMYICTHAPADSFPKNPQMSEHCIIAAKLIWIIAGYSCQGSCNATKALQAAQLQGLNNTMGLRSTERQNRVMIMSSLPQEIGQTSPLSMYHLMVQPNQGSLHYISEHCLVNGGLPLFWREKAMFQLVKVYLLRSPAKKVPKVQELGK